MARPKKKPSVHEKSSSRSRWLAALFEPMDAAGLAFFRIAFYGIMIWEAWRFLENRWVERYFSGQDFYFKFWPFDFVTPWPGDGMKIQVYVMAFCALCAGLGWFYRVNATAVFLMMTHFFLIEQARYLNHLYLVCLLAFLMIFVPAHRTFSLDARRCRFSGKAPAWAYWLLRFQVGVPYFFGGIAKLNLDWFRGEPLREWLADRTDFPFLGEYFENEGVVWTMTYGALLLDLFVVFLLVWRRTRILGFLAALIFHLMNSRLFGIGIFPWTMIAATIIFFDPDWPRRFVADMKRGHPLRSPGASVGFMLGVLTAALLPKVFAWPRALIGGIGLMVAGYHLDEPWRRHKTPPSIESPSSTGSWKKLLPRQRKWVAFLSLWVAVQVALPLRHLVIPGNAHWTEEGHLYAWHMKLRDKDGAGLFTVLDPGNGDTWQIRPDKLLTRRQSNKMLTRPIMIVQFARYLEKRIRDQEGRGDLEVRAEIRASLNGRRPQNLIDPQIDLTQVPYPWFGHADWIVPLTIPLD